MTLSFASQEFLKHGLVVAVGEWPYSSFHRYAEAGLYPLDGVRAWWIPQGLDMNNRMDETGSRITLR